MLSKSGKDMWLGVIIFVTGAAYLFLTTQLPRSGGIDSSTVPYFLSIFMTVLGVVQLATAAKAIRGEKNKTPETTTAAVPQAETKKDGCGQTAIKAKPDYRTVGITAGLIFLYVLLLDYIGFMVISALYLFTQILVLRPKYEAKRYVLYITVSVLVAVVVYYLFYWAFDIMLPHGELWYDLGINMDWSPFD